MDDADGFRVEVRERDGGAASASFQMAMPAGKNWQFHHWTYSGTVLLDNYVERADSKTVLVHPSALYERNVTAGTGTSYYFVGGKRVAVRNATGLYYLHGDHVGSNSVSTDGAGAVTARVQYNAYGATVAFSAPLPAQFGYTGQRFDSGDGYIYDYGARFYDQYIGRFLSADTLVPGAGNPQALNRYAYVLNSPLKYTDPSGHCAYDEEGKISKWDCTVEEFERMSMDERIRWLEEFMRESGCEECFQNILGVLDFFKTKGYSQWASVVDAAILQSYSHGWGMFTKVMNDSANWGAKGSRDFFAGRRAGEDRSKQRERWGIAEKDATGYGQEFAKARGLEPTAKELGLIAVTNVYREGAIYHGGDSVNLLNPFWSGQRSTVTALAVSYWGIDSSPHQAVYNMYKALWPHSGIMVCSLGFCVNDPLFPIPAPVWLP